MRSTVQECRSNGYVKTPFGRRIFIPFINDKIVTRKNFAERSAINAPIQGGAADMIKLAMPKVHKFLIEEKLQTKILLQVHDELCYSINTDDQLKQITGIMENCVDAKVPFKVDCAIADNWGQVD